MPQPRLSEEELALRGRGRVSQANPAAPPLRPGKPRCPKHLVGEARRAFRLVTRMLEERRTVTAGDANILTLYAVLYDRWIRSLEHLQKEGEITEYEVLDASGMPHSVVKPNHWLKVASDCERQMRGILSDLGLNPQDRTKVKPTEEKRGVKFL